jgi:hypothetical protein
LHDPALIFVDKNNKVVKTTNFCEDKKLEEYISLIIEKTSSTKNNNPTKRRNK